MKDRTVRVKCDACGVIRQGQVGQSVEQLREGMAKYGTWSSDPKRNMDLCSSCEAKGMAVRR